MTGEDEVIAAAKAHAKSQMDRAEAIGRENQREQTAATILAALIQASPDVVAEDFVVMSVELADALRKELAKP